MEEITPLFIGGTGRSGTTITLQYLGHHSKIYASEPTEIKILTEKNGFLDLYKNKAIDLEDLKKFYFNFFNKQNFKKEKVKYFADSTPDNIRECHRILDVFSNSKFIHMIRDGRDSGYSEYEIMKGYKFKSHANNPFEGLDFWHRRIKQCFKSLEKIPNEKYINVRLEDLITKNKKNTILNFLNIKEEKSMDMFFKQTMTEDKMSLKKWTSMPNWKEFDKKYNEILKDLKSNNIIIERYY
jgi:hypothetical protein